MSCVGLSLARKTGEILESSLGGFVTSGVINTRYWEGTMLPHFKTNVATLRRTSALAGCWGTSLLFHDNSALYAKLIYYSLLRSLYRHHGLQPRINPTRIADNPIHMNLNTQNERDFDSNLLVGTVAQQYIRYDKIDTFTYMTGYDRSQYNYLRLLARSGAHYSNRGYSWK